MSDFDMNQAHNICILQLSVELPAQLRETLIEKGFPTYVTPDAEIAVRSLHGLDHPILLVCCGEDTDFAFECTKRLISLKDLHSYPLVLLGRDVDSYESILNKHFSLAIGVSTPCGTADIIEAVNYAVRTYPKAKGGIEGTNSEIEAAKNTVSQALRISEEPPVERHTAYSDFSGIPDLFFDQLQSLKLGKDGLGGVDYPSKVTEAFIKAGDYLPTDPRFQDGIRSVLMDAGRWGRLHLYRISYITKNITAALELPEEACKQIRAAQFLFPSSFIGDNPDLLRREYQEAKFSAFRRELCSRIKDSAMSVALNLQAPEVGNLLATLGRLIGREEPVNDTQLSICASVIMAADLADRVCFQPGHWNPRKAYILMQKIRSEQMTDIHPRVLCALVKFLSEAMTSHPFAFIVPRHLRNDPRLQKAAKDWKDQKIESNEKRVPLVSLMPGMKLSRPVITYDGREILSGDLTLDQDLIWRLWQLSSVRPLNGPLVVFSEN